VAAQNLQPAPPTLRANGAALGGRAATRHEQIEEEERHEVGVRKRPKHGHGMSEEASRVPVMCVSHVVDRHAW
jgi:hypothetical protein